MEYTQVRDQLQALADPQWARGQARYGIDAAQALGIPMPALRKLAKQVGKDHSLARELWASGVHEARILASMVDDPSLVTKEQMDAWALDFNSWDLCDQCCGNLFDKTTFAYRKALEWSGRGEEYVKRAGFALMATLAVHDKRAEDRVFLEFLPVIKREAVDERNFVKKAVNWALRQIGKRNPSLRAAAIATAQEILSLNSKSARWIAADALRELGSDQ